MNRKLLAIAILAAACVALGASAASAHDLILVPDNGQTLILKFGHPQEYQAPNGEKLIELSVYVAGKKSPVSLLNGVARADGEQSSVNLTPFIHGGAVQIAAGEYDNGYWSSADGKRYFNTSKLHLAGARRSGYFFKFAKALFPAAEKNRAFARALGMELEIVPRSDPFEVQPEQKLPIEVIWRGKPFFGAGVEIGDGQTKIKEEKIPRYPTDQHGVALVPIAKPGLQIISVEYQTPPRFPELSDYDDYDASLAFFVANHAR